MPTEGKQRIHGFDDHELIVDGARLRYAVSGPRAPRGPGSSSRASAASPTTLPASAPALVLVHGLGGTVENWRGIAPALAERHRVLVPDLPGHGHSSVLPEAAHLDVFCRAILAIAEAEGIRTAVWIGHSLGATVALRAAVRRPDAVSGVVLAAPAGIGSATRLGRLTVTLVELVQPGKLIAPFRRAVAGSRLGRRAVFGGWGVGDAAALEPELAAAFFEGPAHHTNMRPAGRALLATDAFEEADRIVCPILVLWGASDRWVKLDDGIEYARRLGAPLRAIAGAGHLLIGERPEVCVAAIEEFVASL